MKKWLKIVPVVLALTLISLFLPAPQIAYAYSGDGSGETEEDPYLITTLSQLDEVRDSPSAYWALDNDINASDTISWNGEAG